VRLVVQKFGGTSVSSATMRAEVVARVQEALSSGLRSVVVVSAMGRNGDPYATDTLIGLAQSEGGDSPPRDLDLLLSCGEIISTVLMAGTLRAAGIDAVSMTGWQAGIHTDDAFGDAQIIAVEPDRLVRLLEEGRVVVVAGFQGISESGDITTLGRGGSDTTAAALGAALGAEVVEIYTDVDGVKTADPRIVPEARTIEVVGHFEVCQMASEGAKVVHPRAVEIAMRSNVPLRVKSTRGGGPGTLIATGRRMGWPMIADGRPVTAVTHVPAIAQVEVRPSSGELDAEAELAVFMTMAASGISVDLINVSPQVVSYTVPERLAEKAVSALAKLGLPLQVSARPGCAKVSVVGLGMRGVPGVMAKVARALASAGVRILQTADSHATISCLVDGSHMERAIVALHSEFGLGGPPGPRTNGGHQAGDAGAGDASSVPANGRGLGG
jgi:aspartate kinase